MPLNLLVLDLLLNVLFPLAVLARVSLTDPLAVPVVVTDPVGDGPIEDVQSSEAEKISGNLGPRNLGPETLVSETPVNENTVNNLAPDRPLQPIDPACLSVNTGLDTQIWGWDGFQQDQRSLLAAIDHSLAYLSTATAIEAYASYPGADITHERVQRSLRRFRELVLAARSPHELQAWVKQEFSFYRAIGQDGQGTVGFTGYFEPTYQASRYPTPIYRYPLYRLPRDLELWQQPHFTREQLEGKDGLQGDMGPLKGLELVWLADRLQAYLIQVQGSARLNLTDGSVMSVGYAGRTDYPYTSLGRELVNDGKFTLDELTLPKVLNYFQHYPADLDEYLPRNDRFIFFEQTQGSAPSGSLGVPVTGERSIATDKTLMPPGALALIETTLPYVDRSEVNRSHVTSPEPGLNLELRSVSRYVLDQDTGGAIQGPGRVDLYMGTGTIAGQRAGLINATGSLYYLLLK